MQLADILHLPMVDPDKQQKNTLYEYAVLTLKERISGRENNPWHKMSPTKPVVAVYGLFDTDIIYNLGDQDTHLFRMSVGNIADYHPLIRK